MCRTSVSARCLPLLCGRPAHMRHMVFSACRLPLLRGDPPASEGKFVPSDKRHTFVRPAPAAEHPGMAAKRFKKLYYRYNDKRKVWCYNGYSTKQSGFGVSPERKTSWQQLISPETDLQQDHLSITCIANTMRHCSVKRKNRVWLGCAHIR